MLKKISLLLAVIIVSTLSLQGYADTSDKQNTEYVVMVDDVLNISVLGYDNLKSMETVMSDGSISFPYIGTINVKGLSVEEIKKEITEKLSNGYIKYPVVSVSIESSKSLSYFIYGEVVKSGRFALVDNMTVLKAISLAGGITQNGYYGTVRLKRKQGDTNEYTETIINLRGKGKDAAGGDMKLQSDDLIIVERNTDFFVYGEVEKPGKFTLEDNMTVLKAVALAGGFSKYGSPDKVKVLRAVPGKTECESIKVDMKAAIKGKAGEDIRLEPDDIVVVSEGTF